MADNPFLTSANPMQILQQAQQVPEELQPELRGITRQQQLANMLTQQAFQQPNQGQMVSGRYVAPSFFQGIAPMVNAYLGQRSAEQADVKQAALAEKLREGGNAEMQQFNQLFGEGTPDERKAAMQFAQSAKYSQGLRNMAGEMMKPQKLGEGEKLVMFGMGGQPVELATGGAKLPTTVQEYEYAVKNQGYKGSLQDFRQSMRPVTNVNNVSMGAPVIGLDANGNRVFFQPGNRPGAAPQIVPGITPPKAETPLSQELADAGILPNNPQYQQLARSYIDKKLMFSSAPGQINTPAGQTPPQFVPRVGEGVGLEVSPTGKVSGTEVPNVGNINAAYQGLQSQAEAGGKVTGESKAQAIIDLPKITDMGANTKRLVDELVTHPGFKGSVGMGVPFAKHVPGSPQADWKARFDQVGGGAFLQAAETMKGLGALSNTEGIAATKAVTRMSTATSETEFKAAAKDYQDTIDQGVRRMQQKAGVTTTQQPSSSSAIPSGVTEAQWKAMTPEQKSLWQ